MSVSYKIHDSETVLSATFYRQKLATRRRIGLINQWEGISNG